MSTDEGFRLRNGTNRLTDEEAEDGRQETPEPAPQPERESLLPTMATAVSMGILSPKKRKHIPVVRSLKAIAMSSCVFPYASSWSYTHSIFFIFYDSVECIRRIHTPCMDITFLAGFERPRWIDVFSYVFSYVFS